MPFIKYILTLSPYNQQRLLWTCLVKSIVVRQNYTLYHHSSITRKIVLITGRASSFIEIILYVRKRLEFKNKIEKRRKQNHRLNNVVDQGLLKGGGGGKHKIMVAGCL